MCSPSDVTLLGTQNWNRYLELARERQQLAQKYQPSLSIMFKWVTANEMQYSINLAGFLTDGISPNVSSACTETHAYTMHTMKTTILNEDLVPSPFIPLLVTELDITPESNQLHGPQQLHRGVAITHEIRRPWARPTQQMCRYNQRGSFVTDLSISTSKGVDTTWTMVDGHCHGMSIRD
ncbi:hypothetical protein BJ508DRAFT_302562 [Ascobolus immersus RN42]|uniref:Uncharacterized protein n=1 Tax=Ascobolus immersus RN42 TaxID=1160509 RepID=A0A3N4IJX0_ASCIM|nr:hypothetical protein BJ508DRAFT_302562 [Ascobolus immersus RN42]